MHLNCAAAKAARLQNSTSYHHMSHTLLQVDEGDEVAPATSRPTKRPRRQDNQQPPPAQTASPFNDDDPFGLEAIANELAADRQRARELMGWLDSELGGLMVDMWALNRLHREGFLSFEEVSLLQRVYRL
jgi:hypothetical protein